MVRKITCFSSTTARVVLAFHDVVVVTLVSTFAGPFLVVSANRTVGFSRWTGARDCLLCGRGVRIPRRFVFVLAFLSSFACAFCARASGSRLKRADDSMSEGTFIATRAFACLRHLCASHVFLVHRSNGWSSQAGLICLERGLMLLVLGILEIKFHHLLQCLI